MSSNGQRKPPRPQIELLTPAATAGEAAAIVAAVEQFIADTAPAPIAGSAPNPWLRAALVEGVSGKGAFSSPLGEGDPWGR